ncbi:ABC transporter substrate-binding protein [Saliniradius amylolyticus]|nr:sugar ABC transporter substrate-binding protein [Saliniradius amylolyticus]
MRPLRLICRPLIMGLLLCSGPALSAVQIQFWTMQLSPFHDEYVNGLIERFEADHPDIRVKWVDVPWKEMEKKMLASVAARTAPDVVNLNPQFSSKLASYGALADPEDYLTQSQVNRFLPAIWKANRYHGQTFAIPWYLSTTITIYNRQMMQQADVSVPETHEGILEAAKTIKKKLGKYTYFPAMDGSKPLEDLVTSGAKLVNDSQTAAGFNTGQGREFFELYRQLYQQELIPKNVLTEGHHKAVDLFQSGQLAMISTGMQFLNTIKINAPDLYQQIDVAPQLGAQSGRFNVAAMNLAVPMLSRHKHAAFEFAAFVTNAENQMALAKRVPLLPSTKASYQSDFFQPKDSQAPKSLFEKARYVSAEQVLEGHVLVPPLPKYSKLRNSFVRNLQSAMVGKLSVDEAVQQAADTWALFLGDRS